MNLEKAGTRLLILAPVWIPALFIYTVYMDTGAPPPLFEVLGVVLFPVGWCLVGWSLSHLSGWQRLAAIYPARIPPTGQKFLTYGRLGNTRYKGNLYVHVAADGIFLSMMLGFSIGHKPLFIPWSEIHNRQTRKFPFREDVEFDIGAPCVATMWLPKKIFNLQDTM